MGIGKQKKLLTSNIQLYDECLAVYDNLFYLLEVALSDTLSKEDRFECAELLAEEAARLGLPAESCAELLDLEACELEIVKDICAKTCGALRQPPKAPPTSVDKHSRWHTQRSATTKEVRESAQGSAAQLASEWLLRCLFEIDAVVSVGANLEKRESEENRESNISCFCRFCRDRSLHDSCIFEGFEKTS